MDQLGQRFREQIRITASDGDDALTPLVLAQASCAVLSVAGAGLSMTNDLRVPLAATSTEVAVIERLQTTLGDGPCLEATRRGEPLAAGADLIASCWPVYHHSMINKTGIRSSCSVLLTTQPGSQLVLDLYSHDPDAGVFGDPHHLQAELALPMAHLLAAGLAASRLRSDVPNPFDEEPAQDRMRVWTAVGMVMEDSGITNETALAILRGYAFRNDIDLDQAAWLLTGRHIEADDLHV